MLLGHSHMKQYSWGPENQNNELKEYKAADEGALWSGDNPLKVHRDRQHLSQLVL